MPIAINESHDTKSLYASIRSDLTAVRKAEQVLLQTQWAMHAHVSRAKLGEFSEDVLFKPRRQFDIVSRLPLELQETVWIQLSSADRLVLALASKTHAAAFEALKQPASNKPAKVEGKGLIGDKKQTKARAKTQSQRLCVKKSITKEDRLRALHRLRDWSGITKKSLKLCYQCVRFLPKSNPKFSWSAAPEIDITGLKFKEAASRGPHCPACVCRAKYDRVKETEDYRRLNKIIKQTVGLRPECVPI